VAAARRGAGLGGGVGGERRAAAGAGLAGRGAQRELTRYAPPGRRGIVSRSFPRPAAQRHRLEEIRDNLHARITDAKREGWTGEAEGLKVSLAAANNKIAQAEMSAARRAEAVSLGIPAYRDIAATTLTAEGPHEH
jgi:hypothetical protein